MAYFRVSALGLTAMTALTAFLILPCLPRRDHGPDPALVRAYANHRRILVDNGIITGVRVDGDRLRITPGRRWHELSEEMVQIHTRVLAEGLLGDPDAVCVIESQCSPHALREAPHAEREDYTLTARDD
jgi:hypothetical protein